MKKNAKSNTHMVDNMAKISREEHEVQQAFGPEVIIFWCN